MGFRNKSDDAAEELVEADVPVVEQWEYKARNLEKVPGLGVETDFNKLGAQGWEFCAAVKHGRGADGYAVFKRRRRA